MMRALSILLLNIMILTSQSVALADTPPEQ